MANITCAAQKHEQNAFIQSNPRKLLGQQVVVLDKFKVDEELFERVRAQLDAIRPNLIECETYDIDELLGEDFLARLSDTDCRLAGYCLQHLANQPGSDLADLCNAGNYMKFMWIGK